MSDIRGLPSILLPGAPVEPSHEVAGAKDDAKRRARREAEDRAPEAEPEEGTEKPEEPALGVRDPEEPGSHVDVRA